MHEAGKRAGKTQPRVGFVGLWHGRDAGAWSGVPSRIMDALEELGLFGEYLDATPWPSVLNGLRRIHPRADRGVWTFERLPQALLGASNLVSRITASRRCDAWIVPAMGYGRPVHGRVASLCEVTPAQLERADLNVVQTMWRGITPSQLTAFGRQQVRLHKSATSCCVASHWAGESLVRDHGVPADRLHVVGYGANVRLTPPPDRDWSRPRFLFAGIGWRRKNGESVVRAFARLRERFPEATLDLVGDHPRIEIPGVTGHGVVRYQDEVGKSLLTSLYNRSTCFVMPSEQEHFGIVYVEAAAAGLPSIGTTRGGTRTSIGEAGLLVEPDDPEALYAAMTRLSRPDEARRVGLIAQKRAELFTWRKVTERIVRSLELPSIEPRLLAAPL